MQKAIKSQIQADEFAFRFLETDGHGGFISQTPTGANIRSEDSLYSISLKAPIKRYKLLQKFDEELTINGTNYPLSSQSYVNDKRNRTSKHRLLKFEVGMYPEMTFQVMDLTVVKSLIFSNASRQVAVKYQIHNPFHRQFEFKVRPQIAGHHLSDYKAEKQYDYEVSEDSQVLSFESNSCENLYIKSNLDFKKEDETFIADYYYPHDSRDGRDSIGSSMSYGHYPYESEEELVQLDFIISSKNQFDKSVSDLFDEEINRKQNILNNSEAKSDFAKDLALATDNYLVARESTAEKTIIAGYPFFGDWGRDTFWAFNGVCLQTKRFKEGRGILRSFIKYEKNGLIPNMFPEADEYPFYNSVDAPLLFINSIYEYYACTGDGEFIFESQSTIENMMNAYIRGTDYHIFMDEDGLVSSGAGLEQLTWMDIRFDTILPTPRQGKCVEINAMWYNAIKILAELEKELDIRFKIDKNIHDLSELVCSSFKSEFIMENGYLKDVITGGSADRQIRSNAIWAVTQNFSPLSQQEMQALVRIASEHLYTSLGMRTLSPKDSEFKAIYGDSHFERDMAYHQGTVWPFIFGSFVRAYLKSEAYSDEAKKVARKMLKGSEMALSEYCLGQICEVLDGLNPSYSKGCYAQAWSIAEIYRATNEVEK